MTDSEALQRYLQDGSSAAFAELVQRHVSLVYSVARRHVSGSGDAEDVAQAVFIELARNARSIRHGTPLVAWLHVVSRRIALNAARTEARRQQREREAVLLDEMKPSSPPWAAIEPLLDEAVAALGDADRTAVLLRYFENKSLREVGATLGTSDDAAQKRVTRALDQLRQFLTRRGVIITAAGLGEQLSAQAVVTAPTTLTSTIVASSAAVGAAASGHTAAALAIPMSKPLLVSVTLLAATGVSVLGTHAAFARRTELRELDQQNDAAMHEIAVARRNLGQVRGELAAAKARLAAAPAIEPLTRDELELATTLRTWMTRVDQLRSVLAQRPQLSVPELSLLGESDWFQIVAHAQLDSDDAIRTALANIRGAAEDRMAKMLGQALQSYVNRHDGNLPNDIAELAPELAPPVEAKWLGRYRLLQKGPIDRVPAAQRGTIIRADPVDPDYDRFDNIGVSSHGTGGDVLATAVNEATREFARTHNGELPTSTDDLAPYLKWQFSPDKLRQQFDRMRRTRR